MKACCFTIQAMNLIKAFVDSRTPMTEIDFALVSCAHLIFFFHRDVNGHVCRARVCCKPSNVRACYNDYCDQRQFRYQKDANIWLLSIFMRVDSLFLVQTTWVHSKSCNFEFCL